MKIALLSYEYPAETGFGGIGTYTWYQARALVKLGHEVHVVAGAVEPTPLRRCDHDGVVVWRYRISAWRRLSDRLDRLRLWWTRNRLENALSMAAAMRELQRRHRFDVVEMPECGAEGLRLRLRPPTPAVVKFHSPARLIMPFYDVRRLDRVLCSSAEGRAIARASGLSAASRFLAAQVTEHLGVRRPIRVIPNGIDPTLFQAGQPAAVRERFDLPRDRPIVFFAGRMERRKGIHLCAEIVLPILERQPVAFVLAGQDLFGYAAETLLPALRRQPLRGSVHYLGKIEPRDLHALLGAATVFLLPSLWENCSYACLEAMAAGCAIVGSEAGGLPEMIVDGESGLLARAGDPASHRTAVLRLLEDRRLRERLGEGARRRVETTFSDLEIARRSVAFYREVMV